MSFETRMRDTALRLIGDRGKTIVYTAITTGIYNPAMGSAPATTKSATIKAVIGPVGRGFAAEPGSRVEQDERKLMIAAGAMTMTPTPNDKVAIGTEQFIVQAVMAVYAGETIVSYDVWIKRA